MGDYRNSKVDCADAERGSRRFQTVPGPARTDGIGEALRKVFGRRADACPEDLESLLKKLDKTTTDRSH